MNFAWENKKLSQGYTLVAGCDEVGRGCLAGPVVAAAVVLDLPRIKNEVWAQEVRDSKLLSPAKREELAEKIIESSLFYEIGEVGNSIIDVLNIHNSTLLAMKHAINNIHRRMDPGQSLFLYIDGKFPVPQLEIAQEAVVDGDDKIFSVAAASIVAKVYRDNLMQKLHIKFPQYGFMWHKGYGTKEHIQNIFDHGLSPLHRLSFCGNYVS